MSSVLSIWTAQSTSLLEQKVERFLHGYYNSTIKIDTVNLWQFSVEQAIDKINEEFNKLVNLTSSDPTLHLIVVVPCFESHVTSQIKMILDACNHVEHKISVHFIGLCMGLAHLFEVKDNPAEFVKWQDKAIEEFHSENNTNKFNRSFSLIDDYAANGVAIGFSLESLARYIGYIELALSQDYYSILSPTLLSAHKGDNLSVGICSLSFDKASAVDQLLGLGFLASLDKVGINDKKVDSQKAAQEAETFLANITERYPTLYEKKIRPLYKDNGLTEGKAMATASDIIKDDFKDLKEDFESLLDNPELTLPEKEAILAMILGRDNENLEGSQYEHEGTILDDECDSPINQYVKAYNDYCKDTKWLPVRGDFPYLKIIETDIEGKPVEVPLNHEALNPLPDIKRLKQQILNTTSFLREKKEELENHKKSVTLRENVEEIKSRWNKPQGKLRDIEFKEQPLDAKYEPDKALVIKDSVDLRKFFGPIRNQEDLGSCTSFAVASMYEAMMKRNGVESDIVLSPGFLYYYSNILKGRPQGGSNFHDQLGVLGIHGICRDTFYTYDSDNPSKKPSEDAIEDAETHRVLAAKQIPLSLNSDKEKSLDHNHRMITSALSEGLPVGISLKVYDNLGKNGAFILHPTDSPSAKEEGYHAMVIAGYSEENGFYIVRNSWGENFGDNGYCYIPTTYIDDSDYLDFACVITEISDSVKGHISDISTVLANFGATQTEIKMAAIRNAIVKVRIELQESQKRYADYYKYYQQLMLRLTMPKVQNDIRKQAEVGQTIYLCNLEDRKRELEDTFVAKFKDYKRSLQKWILSLIGAVIAFGMVWYYTSSFGIMIVFFVFLALTVLTLSGYKWWVRIKRRELQEQLDDISVNVSRQHEKLMEMQMRFHVAGMWLSNFHKLSMEIDSIYDRLISFNDTLRAWQRNYEEKVQAIVLSESLLFRVFDPSERLEEFFRDNKHQIVGGIDLMAIFKDYQANPADLEKSRERLNKAVAQSISALMENFNIVNFLMGDKFPYLGAANLQQEMDSLIKIGQPSFRNKSHNATSPVRILIGNVETSRASSWSKAISPYFPLRPVLLSLSDPNTLILLTLHPVKVNQ